MSHLLTTQYLTLKYQGGLFTFAHQQVSQRSTMQHVPFAHHVIPHPQVPRWTLHLCSPADQSVFIKAACLISSPHTSSSSTKGGLFTFPDQEASRCATCLMSLWNVFLQVSKGGPGVGWVGAHLCSPMGLSFCYTSYGLILVCVDEGT